MAAAAAILIIAAGPTVAITTWTAGAVGIMPVGIVIVTKSVLMIIGRGSINAAAIRVSKNGLICIVVLVGRPGATLPPPTVITVLLGVITLIAAAITGKILTVVRATCRNAGMSTAAVRAALVITGVPGRTGQTAAAITGLILTPVQGRCRNACTSTAAVRVILAITGVLGKIGQSATVTTGTILIVVVVR